MSEMDSGEDSFSGIGNDLAWHRLFWLGLLGITAFRLWFLSVFPYDLSPDEAYYWDWSRHLSWGYYSKPPMVAWVIALSNSLLGTSEFSVRLPAAIFATITLIALYALGTKMYDARTGFFSALVFLATIGSAVSSMIMTIDAPLLCFWAVSMVLVWQAWRLSRFEEPGGLSLLWWTFAGAVTGLGLLSKQTMMGFSAGIILFILLYPRARRLLADLEPYFFLAVQISLLFPVIDWNQRHNWVTLQHTAHHFESSSKTMIPNLKTFIELLGTQAGIVTPIIFILLLLVSGCLLWRFIRGVLSKRIIPRGFSDREAFLLAVGMIPLVAVFMLSFRQRINANWPAPFYLSLGVLVSAWAMGWARCNTWINRLRRFYVPGIGLGLSMVVLFYLFPVILGVLGWAGTRLDPTVRLKGWHELGQRAGDLLQGFPEPGKTFVVARRRQTVSELAFYMPGRPEVYRWNGMKRHVTTQYELWPGPVDKKGWDALIIIEKDKELKKDLISCFKAVKFIEQIDIPIGQDRKRSFLAYRGVEMKHWAER